MKITRALSALAFALAAAATLAAQGAGREPERVSGDLSLIVSETARNLFKENSNRFRVPSGQEQESWERIIRSISAGNVRKASRDLRDSGFPYRLYRLKDEVSAKEYLVLEESPLMYGWGLFVFDPASESPLIFEIPHTVSDSGTELQGVDAFRRTGAFALIVSATHRKANLRQSPCAQATDESDYRESDPAHNVNTMFHRAHEAIFGVRPDSVAVQLHGMRERDICPDVFVSTGTPTVTANGRLLLECLRARGVNAQLFGDGETSCPLIASTNPQGRFANGRREDACSTAAENSPEPGRFIHIEQEPGIRSGSSAWEPVIEALVCAFPPGEQGRKK